MKDSNAYIALIRGINVGGKNLLPMKELVALLSYHGFSNVKSYIQSGNLVFNSSAKPDKKIENLIEKKFGFTPSVIIMTKNELRLAVQKCPFDLQQGKLLHFYFCQSNPTPDNEKIKQYLTETEQYSIFENVFYFYAPDGIGRSKLAAKIGQCLNVVTTGRNFNTVGKLLEMTQGI